MGCASSKDIDEVEKRKGKKGSQSEKPFDRPGIKYIDENPSNKQPIDDKVSPRDAELELNEESKGTEVNGVQGTPTGGVEDTQVAAEAQQESCEAAPVLHIEEDDPCKVRVTATADEGEVAISQETTKKEDGPEPNEITVTATTEEGEIQVPQESDNVDTSRTEQIGETSASDTQVEGSSVDNALHSNQVPDAINEYAEQLAEEVQKDSIRQLEREAAEEQPQGLPEPQEPEGSSVDAPPVDGGLHVVASDGSIVCQDVEQPAVVTTEAHEPAEIKLETPSNVEGVEQSQAQAAEQQHAPQAAPSGDK